MRRKCFTAIAIVSTMFLAACGADGSNVAEGYGEIQNGPVSMVPGTRSFTTDALIYSGNGAWQPEVAALKDILSSKGATYETATSAELNAMSLADLAQFGAILWPGGYGNIQTNSLTSATIVKVREAVRERGVGWVGFCAGAFVAVNPIPPAGQDPEYGLAIFNGPMLKYYYLEDEFVKQGRVSEDYVMVEHSFPDGTKRDILWYGGPVTPEIPGRVISRYPNGDAAMTQVWAGNGMMILSATHPTSTPSVLQGFGLTDRDGSDYELAWKMIDAVIRQRELPKF